MGFCKDFMWGAASAAFQVEGAWKEDGKTANICDIYLPERTPNRENGTVSSDHYHRMEEDVQLMKEIGLKSYRFSISWARVMPEEHVCSQKGMDFYIRLVKELKTAGIEPLCTIFHWDLPMWAQEKGGWKNPEIVDWYLELVRYVVETLSSDVHWWMTFNEPQCFVGAGYYDGTLPPFYKEPFSVVKQITRNAMLAHGKAVRLIRSIAKTEPKIGFAPTGPVVTPVDGTEEAIEQARKLTYEAKDPFSNSWWADPIVLGKTPEILADVLSEEDLKEIAQPLDFYAYNVYNSLNGALEEKEILPEKSIYPGMPKTAVKWPVTPEVMYWSAKFHYERYGLPILISENGMANLDSVMLDGKVHDPQRTDYISRHLRELRRAAEEGIPVIGYQYWSIMDNMEWSAGYDPRFGLIYIDYRTGERIRKDSSYDYAEIIKCNGENLS